MASEEAKNGFPLARCQQARKTSDTVGVTRSHEITKTQIVKKALKAEMFLICGRQKLVVSFVAKGSRQSSITRPKPIRLYRVVDIRNKSPVWIWGFYYNTFMLQFYFKCTQVSGL